MEKALVLDYGSYSFKAGWPYNFPNDQEPRLVFPAMVKAAPPAGVRSAATDSTVQQAPISSPVAVLPVVQHGAIKSWEGFETVLHHVLYLQFGWPIGEEGSLLLAEPLFTPRADREQLTQLMFEVFNVTGLFVCDEAVLSLYAVGKVTGTVVDIGHDKTDIATVVDGQLYTHSAHQVPVGGAHLTRYLGSLLQARGVSVPPAAALTALKELCAKTVETAAEVDAAMAQAAADPQTHTLADGSSYTLTVEGLQLGEALLRPSLLGHAGPPLAELVASHIMQHPDAAVRKTCFENVMVCGGSSSIPGLSTRLLNELRPLSPASAKVALCGCPEYMPAKTLPMSSWMGGAVLSKIVFGSNQHITKADYDEMGPAIANKKCS